MPVALLAEGVDRNLSGCLTTRSAPVALLAEGVDRNSLTASNVRPQPASPSSRRAWIEIIRHFQLCPAEVVALLAEGVDRNLWAARAGTVSAVALLAEGVDRNKAGNSKVANKHVALLAEGVDRNWRLNVNITEAAASPSSRRAWIEISARRWRNTLTRSPSSRRAWIEIRWYYRSHCLPASPSSRRAWIEITIAGSYTKVNSVALLAEGVDRNRLEIKYKRKFVGRPPRGGRG